MTHRHKKLNKLGTKEDSVTFFSNMKLDEVKKYAGILDTPLFSTNWEISERVASKDEIVEDIIMVMYGEGI